MGTGIVDDAEEVCGVIELLVFSIAIGLLDDWMVTTGLLLV